MTTQLVRPASHRREGLVVLAVVLAVLAGSGALILRRQVVPETIALGADQVSAFSELDRDEQALFNDLYAAGLELVASRRDNPSWLTVADLADLAIPPFAGGAAGWTEASVEEPGLSAKTFLGKGGGKGGSRAFLLVVRRQDPSWMQRAVSEVPPALTQSIWVREAAGAALPGTVDPAALVGRGWRQAVALAGSDVARGAEQHR